MDIYKYKNQIMEFIDSDERLDKEIILDVEEGFFVYIISKRTRNRIAIRIDITPRFGARIALVEHVEEEDIFDLSQESLIKVLELAKEFINFGVCLRIHILNEPYGTDVAWIERNKLFKNDIIEFYKKHLNRDEYIDKSLLIDFSSFLGHNNIFLIKAGDNFEEINEHEFKSIINRNQDAV